MKVLFWKFSEAIFEFEEGLFAGQTIVWYGEPLAGGIYQFYPLGAKIIRPISEEQVKGFFASARGLKVIRKLDENEYPTLMQAIKNYCMPKTLEIKF